MATEKVLGIETEYGIQVLSADPNPTAGASLLIHAYVAEIRAKVSWDFEDESPGQDARGFLRESIYAPEVETHLVNTVLTNGARYYVDHAHPEYSSPECSNPLEILLYDRAGERIVQRSMTAARKLLPPGEDIVLYKNNSDGKGNSYGCHENYLVDRAVPFARLARELTAHLVTRQIYTGSGKVGCEEEGSDRRGFEITQRADFFEEEIGLETTLKRPIINTRDEPHADHAKYRRLHVITGDANLAEVATFLKVGATALVLVLIEDGVLTPEELVLSAPVPTMHDVSHDPTLTHTVELADGSAMTPLEIQWRLYDLAKKYGDDRGFAVVGPEAVTDAILERWEGVLAGLERDPATMKTQLDWVAKYELIDAYCARHECTLADPRVRALDLQYHDLRPERSLFARLGMERLVADADVDAAVFDAPRTTRAYFRGECLKRFGSAVVAANWDSIVFDIGTETLQRVPMMEPLRGTETHVGRLLEGCKDPAELIRRLGV
jgi:proteasome accessory factor A